jgi:hypothetical protein
MIDNHDTCQTSVECFGGKKYAGIAQRAPRHAIFAYASMMATALQTPVAVRLLEPIPMVRQAKAIYLLCQL